jgi:hypothetical protein
MHMLKPKWNVNTSEQATKRKGSRCRGDETLVSVMVTVTFLKWISREILAFLIRSRNTPDSSQPRNQLCD